MLDVIIIFLFKNVALRKTYKIKLILSYGRDILLILCTILLHYYNT